MNLLFCISGTKNSGGMEKVLSQRLNYLVEHFNYDITIVTTENNNLKFRNKENFFYFDPKIKIIDLGINYFDYSNLNFIEKNFMKKIKSYTHLRKLNKIVNKIKPDILVSLGGIDRFISYKINFSCKKILEHHFDKITFTGERKFNSFFTKIIGIYGDYREKKLIDKYDEFLVLTEDDKIAWKNNKIKVINNPLPFDSKRVSNCKNKKIMSVGRLEFVKGFDILIDIWKKVSVKYPDWILEIYGEGSERENLQNKINKLGLEKSFLLKGTIKNIQEKYLESSIYVMSSRHEGMPMVLLEAMSCGLPLISFDCPCGPKSIIKDGENGFLVKFGDIDGMTQKINFLIEIENKRIEMGKKSKELSYNYSQDKIMNEWKELFNNLLKFNKLKN